MFAIDGASANPLCWALVRDCLQSWREAKNLLEWLSERPKFHTPTAPHLNGFGGPHSLYIIPYIIRRAGLLHETVSALLES